MGILENLKVPIVQAPMAGGPSTPELAAAVNGAGGLGFLAAGYLTAEGMKEQIAATRALTDAPFGMNLFVGGGEPAEPEVVEKYRVALLEESDAAGVGLGEPKFDDDNFDEKVEALSADPVHVVSFTFGLPSREVVDRLQSAGSEVWMTVTSVDEATEAAKLGPQVLVVQGFEAGGHRGFFVDDGTASDLSLVAALQLVRAAVDIPLVGAGAIMTGRALASVLVAGASAGQIGTAYLRSPEAGTSAVQRDEVAKDTRTVLTRAFSGRLARGIDNRFHREHGEEAPHAYPEVNHLTKELRAAGRRTGDAGLVNLWAGQAHSLALERPAGEITKLLADDARTAILEVAQRVDI